MNISSSSNGANPVSQQTKGRLVLTSLILLFILPALAAQIILTQNWYQSGVTNRGVLIEPTLNYQMLDVNSTIEKSWHIGYLVPTKCDAICHQQIYLLTQSYIALGKYQQRVTPVLYISESSDVSVLNDQLARVPVGKAFTQHILGSEYLIVDPLGQLVMKYPNANSEDRLINQSKDILSDFRKLLKLSRVG